MKLYCGLNDDELFNLIEEKCKVLNSSPAKWEKHFAILPVSVGNGECRWLEYVEVCKSCFKPSLGFFITSWYAEPKKVLYRAIAKAKGEQK